MTSTKRIFDLQSRANALLELGRPQEAVPLLFTAIGLEPDNSGLRCQLAAVLMALDQNHEALEQINTALSIDAGNDWPHRLRATVLGRLKQPVAALQSALEAARLLPESPAALQTLCVAQIENRKLVPAEQTAQKLLTLCPRDSETHELLAFLALHRRRFFKAEASARESLRLDPENIEALRFLAYALRGQRKRIEATQVWLEVVRLQPQTNDFRDELFDTFGSGSWWRGVFLWVCAVVALITLTLMLDEHRDSGSKLRIFVAGFILLGMLYAALLRFTAWFQRPAPQVLKPILKRRLDLQNRLMYWDVADSIFTGLTGICGLGSMGFLTAAAVLQSWSTLFWGLLLAFMVVGFFKLTQLVDQHKAILKQQLQ
jgi:Flp pilus assembly protein TadD